MEGPFITDIFGEFDAREAEMARQLEHFQAQATTPRGRRIYADVQRLFQREARGIQRRRTLLAGLQAKGRTRL